MESVLQEHQKLENSANLGKTIQDVEHIIGDLKEARAVVERGMLVSGNRTIRKILGQLSANGTADNEVLADYS